MWIGSLALAGIGGHRHSRPLFGFAGFYSKDMVIEAAYGAHSTSQASFAFWLGVAAAFLTGFYSWRLMFMTFHGKPGHSHEARHEPGARIAVCDACAAVSCWRSARSSPA